MRLFRGRKKLYSGQAPSVLYSKHAHRIVSGVAMNRVGKAGGLVY